MQVSFLNHKTSGFIPNTLSILTIEPDISYIMVWNTGSGGMDIFFLELIIVKPKCAKCIDPSGA